ncbi:MAG TPA: hypothetical protein VN788_11975 [Verrucomicrobiae bacterium]|nr:hypothetical protein [Verrucomicrobiae bacterium]
MSGNPQSPPGAVLPLPTRPPKGPVIPVPVTHGQPGLATPSIATPGPSSYPPAFFLQPGGTYFVTSYNAARGGYVLPGGVVIPPNEPHLVTANNWPLGSALVWGDKGGSGQVTASDSTTMAIVNQIIAGRQNPTTIRSPSPATPAGSPAAVLPNHGASTQGNTGVTNAASRITHEDTGQSNLTDKGPDRASGSTGNQLTQNSVTAEPGSTIQPAAKIVEETQSTAQPASQMKTTAMATARETTTVQTCNLCDPWTLTDGHVVSVTSNGETYTGLLLTNNGSFVPFASLPVWSGSTPLNTFTGLVRTNLGYIYYVNGQNTVFGPGSINGGFYANGPGTQIAVAPPTPPSTMTNPTSPAQTANPGAQTPPLANGANGPNWWFVGLSRGMEATANGNELGREKLRSKWIGGEIGYMAGQILFYGFVAPRIYQNQKSGDNDAAAKTPQQNGEPTRLP